MAISILMLVGCATDPAPFQKEVEALGKSTSRKQLYATFPPIEKPEPQPRLVTSNGVSGYESYPISKKHEISYTVRYTASLSNQKHIFTDKNSSNIRTSDRDEVSAIEIRERK